VGRRGWHLAILVAVGATAFGLAAAVGDDSPPPDAIDGLLTSSEGEQSLPPPPPPLEWRAPQPLNAPLDGANGVSRVLGPGLGCDDTPVHDVHLLLEDNLPAGVLSQLTGDARANLGISQGRPGRLIDAVATSRLEPETSHVTLANERGTVRFQLDGGACPTNNLGPQDRINGANAGTGPLTLIDSTGAYRSATFASGTWDLATAADPGADNGWDLGLAGQLAVLAPDLDAEVVEATWGNLGVDYALRVVTVTYRIINSGPGDTFGAVLTATSGGAGVTPLGPTPIPLGDLLSGEDILVTVRYQLALLGPPCQLILLGCTFPSTLTVSMPDALDVAVDEVTTVNVTAPNLPPPLEG
jgi:hypothetical protein